MWFEYIEISNSEFIFNTIYGDLFLMKTDWD